MVPILHEGGLCGFFGLGEREGGEPLGRFDYKLLEVLGTSIVAALQNAESFEKTQRTFLETTAGLIANIEERCVYVRGHSERVTELALALGRELGLRADELESLRYGALLHDLGQFDEYRELLDQAVVLSPSDRRLYRRRVAEHASTCWVPAGTARWGEIVRHQQEYWDGTGLPDNLRHTEIPLGARIVSLANAWDALTHDRPHRPAYSAAEALRILQDRAGRQFDPNLVGSFVRLVEGVPAASAAS